MTIVRCLLPSLPHWVVSFLRPETILIFYPMTSTWSTVWYGHSANVYGALEANREAGCRLFTSWLYLLKSIVIFKSF